MSERFAPQVIRSLLSSEEVAAVRAAKLQMTTSGTTWGFSGEPPDDVRKTSVGWLLPAEYGWLFDRLTALAEPLAAEPLVPLPSVQFGRYPLGGHYVWHRDASDPTFSRYRRVSLSIPLLHAQRGGVLEIKGHQLPSLNSGDCVLFDSAALHRVTPVEAGERESLVAWFERARAFEVHRGFLPPGELQAVLAAFDAQPLRESYHDGKVIAGCTHKIRFFKPDDPDAEQWRWLWDRCFQLAQAFLPAVSMKQDALMLAQYGEGEHYHAHVDSARGQWTESRVVSISVLLEECAAGGGFEFPQYGAVRMAVGDALVFDSDMVHRVPPVEKGRRRALVFWARAV